MSKIEELYRFYLILAEGEEGEGGFYTEQICKIYLTNGFILSKWWISSTYF